MAGGWLKAIGAHFAQVVVPESVDASGNPVTDSAGNPAATVYHSDTFAHERNVGTANQYGAFVEEWNYTAWAHDDGDTIVSSNPVLLKAVVVVSALTGDVTIRDGTDATGTSLGTYTADKDFHGIKLNSGLFIDDNATAGNILIVWRPQ